MNPDRWHRIKELYHEARTLPESEREAFLERYDTELFRGDPEWPPAKEFVAVPDHLLANTKLLRPYLEKSFAYAKTLKSRGGKRS